MELRKKNVSVILRDEWIYEVEMYLAMLGDICNSEKQS